MRQAQRQQLAIDRPKQRELLQGLEPEQPNESSSSSVEAWPTVRPEPRVASMATMVRVHASSTLRKSSV